MKKNMKHPQQSVCFQERPLVVAIRHALPYLMGLSLALSMVQTASSRSSDSAAAFTATQLVRQFTLKNTVSQVSMGMQGYVAEVNGQQRGPAMGARPPGFPSDMGSVPTTVNLPRRDGAGRPLGYCAWDNATALATADYNAGQGISNPLVYAIVSPGLNGNMQTTCADVLATGSGVGDDHVQVAAPMQVSSVQYKSAVGTFADLPPGVEGDVRLVRDTNKLYSYVGGVWAPVQAGPFEADAGGGAGAIAYTTGKVTVADFQAATASITGALSGSSATFTGAVTANTFTGNGAGLVDLNADNFSSGVLGPQFGGTGVNASAAANGTLLIGNGSGFTLGTLTGGAGISVLSDAGAITLVNSGVISITGTADQVIASANNGDIVLSLPQAIATTSMPTFAGMMLNGGLTGTTANFSGAVTVGSLGAQRLDVSTSAGGLATPNMIVGTGAMLGTQSGFGGNTALGINALRSNTTGYANTATGSGALISNTTGIKNTATGWGALEQNTSGSDNTVMGNEAAYVNTTGYRNTATGARALFSNSTGYDNVAVGNNALRGNTTGFENVALGRESGFANTTGSSNTFLGYSADATTGALTYATAIGALATVATSNTLALGRNSTADQVVIGTNTRSNTYANTKLYVNGVTNLNGDLRGTTATFSGAVNALSFAGDGSALTNLNASNFTTGNVPVARGGTGLDGSAAPNGSLLIGNGTGYSLNTLTGTANQVNVTNGAGTITLSLPQSIATTSTPTFGGITSNGAVNINNSTVTFNNVTGDKVNLWSGFGFGINTSNLTAYVPNASDRFSLRTGGNFNGTEVFTVTGGGLITSTGGISTTTGTFSGNTTVGGNLSVGGNLVSNLNVTQGNFVRFGHANELNADDGKIGAGLFGEGLNIVGTKTTVAGSRLVSVYGNTTFSGDVTASTLQSNAFKSISSQGAHLQWNRDGASGRTYLINQRGGGGGGISFGESTTGDAFTQNMFLDASGNLSVVGSVTANSFSGTTAAFSGNTTVGGTFGVTGATTLGGTLGVTGATTLGGTLGVTGATTLTGALAANGGISSTTGSFSGNVTASTFQSFAFKPITSQGVHLQWNRDGASGRTYLINQRGGGGGGISFGEATTGDVYTENMALSSTGNLTVVGSVTASGGITGTTANFSGNTSVGGTLAVTGGTTLNGAVAVNNSEITFNDVVGDKLNLYTDYGFGINGNNLTAFIPSASQRFSVRTGGTYTGFEVFTVSGAGNASLTGGLAAGGAISGTAGAFTGNVTVGGSVTATGLVDAYGGVLVRDGSKLEFGPSGSTTDQIFIQRSNLATDQSRLQIILGDNNEGFGVSTTDEFQIGNIAGGTFAPRFRVAGSGDAIFSGAVTMNSLAAQRIDVSTSAGGVTNPNMIVGTNAMPGAQSGLGGNTALGVDTLSRNTTGFYNTASGFQSLTKNTIGNANTATGVFALTENTDGDFNTASGYYALTFNTTGNDNSAFGVNALITNTSGAENVAVGSRAMQSSSTGSQNVAVGFRAGFNNSTGSNNTLLGAAANVSASALTYATAIGSGSLVATSNTLALGRNSTADQVVIGTATRNDTFASTKLYVNGVTNLNGDLRGTTATFSGNTTVGGTLAVTGATTLNGAVAVNNSAITFNNILGDKLNLYSGFGFGINGDNLTAFIPSATQRFSLRTGGTYTGTEVFTVTGGGLITSTGGISTTTGAFSGNTSVGGTLAVTGGTTLNGAVAVNNSEITFNDILGDKLNLYTGYGFGINGGNLTAYVSGGTDRFSVRTGGTYTGTEVFTVTGGGLITSTGGISTTTGAFSGNTTVGGTLAVTGGTTLNGAVAVNNSEITFNDVVGDKLNLYTDYGFGINGNNLTAFIPSASQRFSVRTGGTYTGFEVFTVSGAGNVSLTGGLAAGGAISGTTGTFSGAVTVNSLTAQRINVSTSAGGVSFANMIVGTGAMAGVQSGTGANTALGINALNANTTGYANTGSGYRTLEVNTSGYGNTANGSDVLRSNTTGYNNTASGYFALANTTTGFENTATGRLSGSNNTTGSNNTFLGAQANATTGALTYATAIGAGSTVATSGTIALGRIFATDQVVLGTDTRNDTFANTKLYVNGVTSLNGDLRGTTATFSGNTTVDSLLVRGSQAIATQGSYLQWNRDGGSGRTFLVNQRGGGGGGISFGEVTTGNAYTENMALSSTGNLSVVGSVTANGGITSNGAVNVNNSAITFNNVLGNKLNLYSGFGFGINGDNLTAYVPGAGQRFSLRTGGNFNGAEVFTVTGGGLITSTGGISTTTGSFSGALTGTTATFSGNTTVDSLFVRGSQAIATQGSYLQWNRDGGSGRTFLVNQRGGGGGGISFGEVTTGNVYTENMTLSSTGNLVSAGSITANGGLSTTTGTFSGAVGVSGNLSGNTAGFGGAVTTGGLLTANSGMQLASGSSFRFGVFNENTDDINVARLNVAGDASVLRFTLGDNGNSDGFGSDEFQFGSIGFGTFTNSLRIAPGSGDVISRGYMQATSFNATSDRRLKKNITVQENNSVLERLEQLQTYSYEYINAPSVGRRIGVIAQEIQSLFPEAVSTSAENGMMSVDYNALGAMAAMGVGQLNSKFKVLDGKVTLQGEKLLELDGKVAQHNTRIGALESWKTEAVTRMDNMQGAIDLNIQKIAENTLAIQTNTKAIERLDDALLTLDGTVKGNTDAIAAINARWARNFTAAEDGSSLTVNAVELKVSNFTAQQMRTNSLYTQRLEAEIAKIAELEVNNLRANTAVANTVQAEQVNTGSIQVYAGVGLPAVLFAAKADGHYTVSTSALDGSYATATVIVNAGQAKVVSVSSEGIELVAEGNMVKAIAAGKSIKASWIKMG